MPKIRRHADLPGRGARQRGLGETSVSYADPATHWRERLNDGLAHDIGLVIAKAVQGQLAAGVPKADVVRQVALFGAHNRDGWGVGLTMLTALANLLPALPEDEAYLALFHGARRVAADCDGQPPRRERAPLGSRPEPATLKRRLRRWTKVRHREAAERTLLTAIAEGLSPAPLADALLAAETEKAFADDGHSLYFINKAFECLDLIGWGHASSVLSTVVGQMAAARGAEESTEWRQPVDLVALCDEAASQLPAMFAASRCASGWSDHAALARELLGDDPVGITEAIETAVRQGAAPADLGRSLAYGTALRAARFGNANEHADWETAHHVFTYANALCQMLGRIGIAAIDHLAAARAVLHGAMALYLTRYLKRRGRESRTRKSCPGELRSRAGFRACFTFTGRSVTIFAKEPNADLADICEIAGFDLVVDGPDLAPRYLNLD